jgi:adenylate kinase
MKKVIVLYGLAAAGKTTQADLLAKKYGLYQFGMGDRLRAEINSGSELGQKIADTVAQGLLVSDELITGVLQNVQQPAQETGIIFDGFPRMVPQAELLDKIMAEVGLEVDAFILLDITVEEAEKRIAARAEATGRSDDKDKSVVNNRLEVFRQESEPLIARYQETGKFIRIDGSQAIEKVFAEIEKHLN